MIVADGGSVDGTAELAEPLVDRVIHCRRGRALQMNAGASWCHGNVIWFLHADTRPPEDAVALATRAIARGADWGWFDLRISGQHIGFRTIERLMNLRARMSGVATGDQALFVRRSVFRAVGGFPDVDLMEDVAISKRLRARWPRRTVGAPVVTSSRRWERDGVVQTILMMWRLRLAYFLGADPQRLAERYYRGGHMGSR